MAYGRAYVIAIWNLLRKLLCIHLGLKAPDSSERRGESSSVQRLAEAHLVQGRAGQGVAGNGHAWRDAGSSALAAALFQELAVN